MTLYDCDHGDFYVIYEDRIGKITCPVCAKDDEINDLESRIEELESQIEEQ